MDDDSIKITFIGEAGKGKTLCGICPYCKLCDLNVVIMFHIQSCPKRPKEFNDLKYDIL